MGSQGHYPYPNDEKGNPMDTCEWRDACKIDYHAPKAHEKGAPDNDLFKAIRSFSDTGMGPVDAALAAGADINAKDKLGYTALHLSIKNKLTELANKLVEVGSIDVNLKTNKGFTPIHVAAWKGDIDMVETLIKKGADIKAKDTAGRNVWGIAHDWHKEEILELLKRHDFHYATGDVLAFPPHPKWRPENRDKM
eukprot:CAMPEP_0115867810 /NCGR_PEP_ID=MMETSP0287-20121206/20958_1 /TAXON_ID=412157 /ORGANISM="Chrysochromulina rotalis, Strain UIO044" /LENGTH=193 /DNA_ID=CAMNT_0003322423 /DNA_START=42 /DNA_END=623 /DNA_ORIENTATION=-